MNGTFVQILESHQKTKNLGFGGRETVIDSRDFSSSNPTKFKFENEETDTNI